jgi:Chromo (CHRromatin Organisation MOdifier) domain
MLKTRACLVHAHRLKVQRGTAEGLRPEWQQVERIFAERRANGKVQYLCKWNLLGYAESTWEDSESLTAQQVRVWLSEAATAHGSCARHTCDTVCGMFASAAWLNTCDMHVQEASLVKRFKAFSQPPPFVKPTDPAKLVQLLVDGKGLPTFKNGRKLRDYQEASFKWMVQHNLQGQGCVLGDEMGLGKTAQARLCLLQQADFVTAAN